MCSLLTVLVVWSSSNKLQTEPFPIPERQYPEQEHVVRNFSEIAKHKSQMYRAELLDILDTVAIRNALNKSCPGLVKFPAQKLLDRILEEMAVSELLHTFASSCNNEGDTDLPNMENSSYLYNLWQVEYLNLTRGPRLPKSILNGVETNLFNLLPFNDTTNINADPKSFDNASKRLIYTAWNAEKVSGPNNGFGDITVIFNTSIIKDLVVVSPVDTGYYWAQCGHGNAHPSMNEQNCSAWDRSMGTLNHIQHLIVYKYYMSYGNESYDKTGQIYPLIDCNPIYNGQTRIHGWPFSYPYMEANIIGNALYDQGAIQAIAVSFSTLFGTAMGDLARKWCLKNKWILFWSFAESHAGSDLRLTFNGRILDPMVFAESKFSHNYKIRRNDSDAFDQLLNESRAIIATGQHPSSGQLSHWWTMLQNGNASTANVPGAIYPATTLATQPLSARQCHNPQSCVAVTQKDLTCICREN